MKDVYLNNEKPEDINAIRISVSKEERDKIKILARKSGMKEYAFWGQLVKLGLDQIERVQK